MTYQIDDSVLHELGCTDAQLRTLLEKTPGGEEGEECKDHPSPPHAHVRPFSLCFLFFSLHFFFSVSCTF